MGYRSIGGYVRFVDTGLTTIDIGNTLFVDDVNGSDATGTRGRLDLPYATPAGALADASAGDLIWVWPGSYTSLATFAPTININLRLSAGAALTGASGVDVIDVSSAVTVNISGLGTVAGTGSGGSALLVNNASAVVTTEDVSYSSNTADAVQILEGQVTGKGNVTTSANANAIDVRGTQDFKWSDSLIQSTSTGGAATAFRLQSKTAGRVELNNCEIDGNSSGGVGGFVLASSCTGLSSIIIRGDVTNNNATTFSSHAMQLEGTTCTVRHWGNVSANGGTGVLFSLNSTDYELHGNTSSVTRDGISMNGTWAGTVIHYGEARGVTGTSATYDGTREGAVIAEIGTYELHGRAENFDSASTSNAIDMSGGSGTLILANATLITGNASADCITATSAQNVTVYKAQANAEKNSNITELVGTIEVDTANVT